MRDKLVLVSVLGGEPYLMLKKDAQQWDSIKIVDEDPVLNASMICDLLDRDAEAANLHDAVGLAQVIARSVSNWSNHTTSMLVLKDIAECGGFLTDMKLVMSNLEQK